MKISTVINVNITILEEIELPGFEETSNDDENEDAELLLLSTKRKMKENSKDQKEVTFTENGWSDSDVKPKITITYDMEKFKINTESMKNFEIIECSLEDARNRKDNKPTKKSKNKTGMIVGIVVGCVVLLVIIAVLIWYFAFYRKKKINENEVSDKEDYSVGF